MLLIVCLSALAGAVVFCALFIIMGLKGNSVKLPAIGLGACCLVVAVVTVLVLLGIGVPDSGTADGGSEPSAVGSQDAGESEPPDEGIGEVKESAQPSTTPTQEPSTPETSNPATDAEPTPAPSESVTLGQRNALSKAKQYLSVMPFSYSGLIGQLEFDGYTTDEATYGADNCEADWNEQAAKKAQQYLDIMAFSRQGLIDQLKFDGFTQEQAEYGVTEAGY